MCVGVHVSWYLCGDQRTTWKIQFSLSAGWVLGIELRSSGLAASTFTCRALLVAPKFLMKHTNHFLSTQPEFFFKNVDEFIGTIFEDFVNQF